MQNPVISIITPSYNKSQYIEATIRSVLDQSFSQLEHIVVDDGSNDGTKDLLTRYAAIDPRFRFEINETNRGANYCRNRGLEMARGGYVIFLDADDLLSKRCCEERLSVVTKQPELDFAVFTLEVFAVKPGDRSSTWVPESKKPLDDFLVHKLPWQTMQPIWNRDFLRRINGFDESFQRMQDVELHTRALLANPVFATFPGRPDCYFRTDEARLNFSGAIFMQKWIQSATKYCEKFCAIVSPRQVRLLRGTLYEALVNLAGFFKKGAVTQTQFSELQAALLSSPCLTSDARRILRTASAYNKHMMRVPGINWMLKNLLIRI